MRILLFLLLFVLAGCDEAEEPPPPPPAQAEQKVEIKPTLVLEQVSFDVLPDWGNDNFQTFGPAFQRSCARMAQKPSDQTVGILTAAGTYGDWQEICKKFKALNPKEPEAARRFFEANFTPHSVMADYNPNGLFTGYYEASLKGSPNKNAPYTFPLHHRPGDLVMVQLGDFREDLKGIRIAGRVEDGQLKPYETRDQIVAGDWPNDDEVLVWVDDAVDAFFVQIQGSGLVQMEDGSVMRIGYAGQNGHPYFAIGRELIERGELTKENVSMQSIREWLATHPEQADEIMNTNKSYVFFREITGDGPLGAEGIPLTAGRSLAVDRTMIPYGVPLWVDIDKPVENAKSIRRMMIAQDTGGAINGPVRGDVFWGYGDLAEEMAGRMKSEGRYWVMLPKVRQQLPESDQSD